MNPPRTHSPWRMKLALGFAALFIPTGVGSAADPLRISVYATAGDVITHLSRPEDRSRVITRLAPLQVQRLFLEGRRGDEWVRPEALQEIRASLHTRGIECAGGIATVPGAHFGTRQNGDLGWLNWETAETRSAVADFFRGNAPVFEELIVDDFYCTADTSAVSEAARGTRSWSEYRRDLLADSLQPLILEPTRAARPETRLILKFPQWYDRFHLFGYDPARMAPSFDRIWVGTEVRNPATRRMGYVQPTEGFINFRWIRAVAGPKVTGAWFDHIECTPENFVDQAFLSVLAGARELTLFRLGDLMSDPPGAGDTLLAKELPALRMLAEQVQAAEAHPRGVPYLKPPNADPADNLYLMDTLAMLGIPILPVAVYPVGAKAMILGAPAAANPGVLDRVEKDARAGATVMVTPAFLRIAGSRAGALAGVGVGREPRPGNASEVRLGRRSVTLTRPIELDATLSLAGASVRCSVGQEGGGRVPMLTQRRLGAGSVWVLNIRTFSETDFRESREWLLAPKPLGWNELPQPLVSALRRPLLRAEGLRFEAPAGVALVAFEDGMAMHNFQEIPVEVQASGHRLHLSPHSARWVRGKQRPSAKHPRASPD